ncbi:MAG: ATP-binding protein, partial [Candidatus Zixiibacteriota bacterium]
AAERRLLALDALTKLTRQFAEEPHFENAAQGLLLVLAGQLSVGSAFTWLYASDASSNGIRHSGIGRFRELAAIPSGLQPQRLVRPWQVPGGPDDPGREYTSRIDARLSSELIDSGVRYLAPLRHQSDIIGVVGLGARLTGKPFDRESEELLSAILGTVTPFLVNTLLFERLARLGERHQTILGSVGQGVFVFDKANRLVHLNTAGRALLELHLTDCDAADKLLGSQIEQVFPGAGFPGWLDKLRPVVPVGESPNIKSLIAPAGGVQRVYNARCRTLQNEGDARDDGWVLTLDDITQQRDSENRLGELERMAEKGVMASGIAHELNNFLGMILGGVELTQIALNDGKADKAGIYLARLKDNALQMERYTAGLMDYGRLQSQRERADLNSVINDVLSFAAVQKRFKRIRFTVNLEPDLPEFEMDKDQIAQLLLNLLNNAGDAIAEIRDSDGRIAIATTRTPDSISLIVADNGAGMPPAVRDRLFKSQLTTKTGGHGYGLITCARIIAGHQGKVEVESEPGAGTRIIVHFPRTT